MRQLQGSIFDCLPDETPLDPGVILVTEFDNLTDTASRFVKHWLKSLQFGLDIETFGEEELDGLNCWRGHIRLIQIALTSGKTLIIDLGGWDKLDAIGAVDYYQKFKDSQLFKIFAERLWNENVRKVLHNGKFDALWIRQKFGLRTRTIRDTEILSRVMWSGVFAYNHSLKDVAARVLGVELDKTEQKSDFGAKLTNNQLNYAARDAQITLAIFQILGAKLKAEKLMFTSISDCGSIEAFVEMEYKGFPVSEIKVDSLLFRYKEIQTALAKEWHSYCPFTQHQSAKVKDWINSKYALDISGTSQEDLAPYWDIRPLKVLSIIRTLDFFIGYIETAKECLKYYGDGMARGSYKVVNKEGLGRSGCGAMKAKGKVVCPGLNLQNPASPAKMPQEFRTLGMPPLRDIFVAPDGYKLIVADLSGAHGRIAAEASQDPVLCKALRDGLDFHSITAERLAKLRGKNWTADEIAKGRKDKNDPDKDAKEALRQTAKPTFYGSQNLQGSDTLRQTAEKDGVSMTRDEAVTAIAAWKETYKGIVKFQKQISWNANKFNIELPGVEGIKWGAVISMSGRRIYLQKKPSKYSGLSVYEPNAVAAYWTSTEADVIKPAMLGIQREIDEHPQWDAWICNLAHDEIDVIVKEEYAEEVAKMVWSYEVAAFEHFLKTVPVEEPHKPGKPPWLGYICKSWSEK